MAAKQSKNKATILSSHPCSSSVQVRRKNKMGNDKIQSIEDYLSKQFPNCSLENHQDFSRGAQIFNIGTEKGILVTIFSEEFIEDNKANSIIKKIDNWNLIDQLRNNYSAIVIVTNNGIKFESRYWDIIKSSLENNRYKWRTTRGVVKETGLSFEEVEKAFRWHSDQVIKSSIPSDSGEDLFTTRQHYRKFQSPFTKIISSIFSTVSSSTSGSINSSGEDE